ncbi:glutathione S-transferase N-terminal domain-containing protein [Pleionea sediminis]|uniref:glutathione S-transferase N-terminal domain-containing protein n=1 Tax=Pleionea sediminis TaxID=2569479 RepID=UPI00118485E7|nr:glutathione S-transferase N-terminal domain-containing protein [Pleionea sediminis]
MIKLIRLALGGLIVSADRLTRGPKLKRPEEQQREVERQVKSLALYQFSLCPFCVKVRRKMHKLNLPIEIRDAKSQGTFRDELLNGGGKIKVPCLRIETQQGARWMYESSDINRYLEREFG